MTSESIFPASEGKTTMANTTFREVEDLAEALARQAGRRWATMPDEAADPVHPEVGHQHWRERASDLYRELDDAIEEAVHLRTSH